MGSQLCQRNPLAVDFVQQRRHRAVQFVHLHPHIAGIGVEAHVADAFDVAKSFRIEGAALVADGELDQMFASDRRDEFTRRPKGDLPAMVHDGDAVAQLFGFVHVVGGQQNRSAFPAKGVDHIP